MNRLESALHRSCVKHKPWCSLFRVVQSTSWSEASDNAFPLHYSSCWHHKESKKQLASCLLKGITNVKRLWFVFKWGESPHTSASLFCCLLFCFKRERWLSMPSEREDEMCGGRQTVLHNISTVTVYQCCLANKLNLQSNVMLFPYSSVFVARCCRVTQVAPVSVCAVLCDCSRVAGSKRSVPCR